MSHSETHTHPEPFELSGGAVCLDFANTWGDHSDPGSDRLLDYEHLLAFACQAGCLSESQEAALSKAAAGDADQAISAFSLSREIRQIIYRIFSSRAGSRDIPPADVDRINALLGEALSHRTLMIQNGEFVWSWAGLELTDLRAPLWPIVESAASLLVSSEFVCIRECGSYNCNWLFLDRSRSGNRRWCSMKSCGNRAKARRHYRRRRKR